MDYSRHPTLEQQIVQAREHLAKAGSLVVWGPTGSGKTHLVRCFHQVLCPDAPLVFQEAAGLADARFESQMFGHVRGAFSGAVKDYPGLLGAAEGGLLCIEGLAQVSPESQARLLRFLQERRFRQVGDTREREWHGLMVFTSQRAPNVLRAEGVLRPDLYFRIATGELHLPGLGQRMDDYQDLCSSLIDRIAQEIPIDLRRPTAAELDALRAELPEGNLHGLHNLLQRAMIQGCAPLEALEGQEAAEEALDLPDTGSLSQDLHLVEGRLLQRALLRHQGTRTELAATLGISRRKLMYLLKEHGLSQGS